MKNLAVLIFVLLVSVPSLAIAASPAPGIYRDASDHRLYVGIDEEPPDRLINYFDPQTQADGAISQPGSLHLEKAVSENRVHINAPHGPLGVSLWYADNRKRAAIILIHGNEAETRNEGFFIPYFVLNGINVISYDQRGTGESAGDWQKNGPIQRAEDVAAIYDMLAANPFVDGARMGVWGFSNGGWTAPILATKRPIAFMILMSAPAGTIADNIYFELRQRMLHDHFNEKEISAATATLRAQIDALAGTESWDRARTMYEAAIRQKWFADLAMRPHQQFPPANGLAEAQRRALLYDPLPIVRRVTVPTLALYGALDRNVDSSHDSALLRTVLTKAGVRDLTVHVYENAGHSLSVSADGHDEGPLPRQYVRGFPRIMLDWLKRRGFLNAAATPATRRAP
jgi:pimeloyl-ACP methyl ester carboxylesterase